jgi:hypothetical protein
MSIAAGFEKPTGESLGLKCPAAIPYIQCSHPATPGLWVVPSLIQSYQLVALGDTRQTNLRVPAELRI